MATSLNVICAICSEYFSNLDRIYSTGHCGHAFHQQCLFRWLSRSSTCPQCRRTCHRRNVHRLYLNFSEPQESQLDIEEERRNGLEWVYHDESITEEEIKSFGFKLGLNENDEEVYAARVYLHDDLLPAYYVPRLQTVYAAWNCSSHSLKSDIELLDISQDNAEYKWVAATSGVVPENALDTGYSETGETLYLGRATYEGRVRYGKLHPSHSCVYMPFEDKEVSNREYEVLVREPKLPEKTTETAQN